MSAEVRLGFANPLSGPFAASGERNRQAAQLAVAMLNSAGGVLGHEIRLVAVDETAATYLATGIDWAPALVRIVHASLAQRPAVAATLASRGERSRELLEALSVEISQRLDARAEMMEA